ncbi:hypothetical protein HHI36_010659, partial [Cryptolaemus montrouzieri]
MEVIMHEATNGMVESESAIQYNKVQGEVKYNVPVAADSAFKTNNAAKFNRLPTRNPVDITFRNIVYTASLGFRKG